MFCHWEMGVGGVRKPWIQALGGRQLDHCDRMGVYHCHPPAPSGPTMSITAHLHAGSSLSLFNQEVCVPCQMHYTHRHHCPPWHSGRRISAACCRAPRRCSLSHCLLPCQSNAFVAGRNREIFTNAPNYSSIQFHLWILPKH